MTCRTNQHALLDSLISDVTEHIKTGPALVFGLHTREREFMNILNPDKIVVVKDKETVKRLSLFTTETPQMICLLSPELSYGVDLRFPVTPKAFLYFPTRVPDRYEVLQITGRAQRDYDKAEVTLYYQAPENSANQI